MVNHPEVTLGKLHDEACPSCGATWEKEGERLKRDWVRYGGHYPEGVAILRPVRQMKPIPVGSLILSNERQMKPIPVGSLILSNERQV